MKNEITCTFLLCISTSIAESFLKANLDPVQHDGPEEANLFFVLFERIASLERAVKDHPLELEKVRYEQEEARVRHLYDLSKLKDEFENKIAATEEFYKKEIEKLKEQIEQKCGKPSHFVKEQVKIDGGSITDDSVTDDIKVKEDVRQNSQDRNSVARQGPVRKARKILKRQINGEVRVAFFAKISTNTPHLGFNQPISFDNVTTNIGNYYDKHIGVFRAPTPGVYLFSTTITSLNKNSGHFGFFINERRETWFYNNGNENAWDETSQTMIVYLDQGDDVTVRSLEADHGVTGVDHSVFSGVLLFEYDPSSVVIG